MNSQLITLLSGIVCTIASVGLVLLVVAGAINSRAEEDYWATYWNDTPTTESGDEIHIRPRTAIDEEEVRRAA